MRFDILAAQSMRPRPAQMMEALAQSGSALGHDIQLTRHYSPRAGSVLITYGLGGSDRWPYARQHASNGWHYVAFDAGYWERKTKDRRYRVSIDGFHCPKLIMRGPDPGPERLAASKIEVSNHHSRYGDVILVGNSSKAALVGANGWAARKSAELRRHSSRTIVYRPKHRQVERGVLCDRTEMDCDIEKLIAGASLVVCLHSNVAVDACRLGIPVVCEDGAAAAIYPSRLKDEAKQPSEAVRMEFLRRLAWWQWSESEMERGDVWRWLIGQLQ
jgi:hypothetical protein